MLSKLTSIFILLLLTQLALSKLSYVVAVISPGARYHLNDFYDGNQTRTRWGELTSVGLRQQESLGKAFRKLYVQNNPFLSQTYHKEEVQILSMASNRTVQSVLANLYGMYPLGNGQKLQPADKQYRYPPYNYKEDVSEDIFALPQGQLVQTVSYSTSLIQTCPNEAAQIQKNIRGQLTDYNEMLLTYTPFLKQVATTFGIEPSSMNFSRLAALYDTVRTDRYLGRALPASLKETDLTNMEHLYHWYGHFSRVNELGKAYNTYKFNQIISAFDNKIKSPSSQAKWLTISVQEVDLWAAQNALGIASAGCIQDLYRKGTSSALNCQGSTTFGSSLLFELEVEGNDWLVRIRKNGKYVNLCGQKQTKCPYDQWKAQVKSATTSDPLSICNRASQTAPVILQQ